MLRWHRPLVARMDRDRGEVHPHREDEIGRPSPENALGDVDVAALSLPKIRALHRSKSYHVAVRTNGADQPINTSPHDRTSRWGTLVGKPRLGIVGVPPHVEVGADRCIRCHARELAFAAVARR